MKEIGFATILLMVPVHAYDEKGVDPGGVSGNSRLGHLAYLLQWSVNQSEEGEENGSVLFLRIIRPLIVKMTG